jgi:hypothetical protein
MNWLKSVFNWFFEKDSTKEELEDALHLMRLALDDERYEATALAVYEHLFGEADEVND